MSGLQACPRCRTLLSPGDGGLQEDVCGGCRGRFLPAAATERIVVDELGVDRATLREIAALFSGHRLACPGCAGAMRPMRLHGVLVDLCFACGGLWLDGGELTSLTAGRHAEVGGNTPPTIELRAEDAHDVVGGRVILGRGTAAVLFSQPDSVVEAAVARAFADTDGLTAIDAKIIVGSHSCVVVENASVEGARGLVRRLLVEGIVAEVVGGVVLKVPTAQTAQSLVVNGDVAVLGFHTGPSMDLALADIAGLAAGITKVERSVARAVTPSLVTRLQRGFGRDSLVDDVRVDSVIGEALIVEALIVGSGAPRRLRLSTPPVRRDVIVQFVERCRDAGVPLGRCRSPWERSGWPVFNRARDIERDAVWAAWRAARWPVA